MILAEGKPANMVEKIAAENCRNFSRTIPWYTSLFVKDSSKTVAQYLDSVSKGLAVAEFKRVAIG